MAKKTFIVIWVWMSLLLGDLGCNGPGGPSVAVKGGAVYENKTEKPLSAGLPDGSKVLMGPHTVVRLFKTFGQTRRELDLDGVVLLDVVPDAGKPFIVHTRLLQIEVLGTRFRVDGRRENAGEEVDLMDGRLRVKKSYHSDTDNEAEEIQSGEMVMVNRDIDLMEKEKMDSTDRERIKGFR
jgi:transmembrane sensor